MDSSSKGSEPRSDGTSPAAGERTACVVAGQAPARGLADDISLRDLWRIAWRGKRVIIATTFVCAVSAIGYALLATEWYRAEVLLAPAEQRSTSSIIGQLGGLAALAGVAGVSVGGGGSVEAVAALESRELARAFIEDHSLTTTFFVDDWDFANNRWHGDDPSEWPDVRDAIKYFHEEILSVDEDRKSSLVTLAIEWTDPKMAAQWADELVHRVNARLRERALRESTANVAYLQAELTKTSVVTLQQSVGRLLESELQRLMLARGNEEFAFRIIDPPEVPKEREWPKRALVVILGTMLGGMLGVIWVFLWHSIRPETDSVA